MGKIKIVVSDQQPFMIDGIIGFLGHYPDLYEVVGGYKDLKKAIAECNKIYSLNIYFRRICRWNDGGRTRKMG